MKITYLHQYFNSLEMAGGTRSYEMARLLVKMGHEVSIVTSWREDDGRSGWFTTDVAGFTVHWLPVAYSNHMGYRRRTFAFLKFAWGSAKKAASIPSDVIFATSTPLTICLPAVYAARRLSVPMIFEVRDLWPEVPIAIGVLRNPILRWAARQLEKFAYKNATSIVSLSPGMRDGVIATGYPSECVTVIPNSSDLDLFGDCEAEGISFRKQHGIPDDAVLVVYAGSFGKVNGVDYLVRLAAAMKMDKGIYFVTVGGGGEFVSVQGLASELGCLGVNLLMVSEVRKSEIPSVLAAANIVTSLVIPIPELEANSANKVFDGLAAGRCVAVNHGGWISELLESTGSGFRLSTSIYEAARQLRFWIGKPELIKTAGLRARTIAEDRFSRDRLAFELEKVIRSAHKEAN